MYFYRPFIILSFALALSACSAMRPAVVPVISLPRASEYNVQLGLAYLKAGDVARAKYKLLLAQRQAPNSATATGALAYFLAQTGEWQQAERYYLAAIKLNPTSGAAHNHYGSFLCQHSRYAEAEVHFLRATQDPSYLNLAEIYENAGLCALRLPNKEKAVLYFKKALEKDPTRSVAAQMLASLRK